MASFNLTSGITTIGQDLFGGETGRVALGANLNVTGDTAIHLMSGAFSGTMASPTIVNDGFISSDTYTIYADVRTTGVVYLYNTGIIISSSSIAVVTFFGGAATVFENSGLIISDSETAVLLDAADDTFVVRNGSSTTGFVDGFDGIDSLYYGLWTGSGVNVLLGGAATGMNSNRRFENVYGSAQGDSITGETSANVLNGLDGNDILSGLAGNDTLFGANGNDTLLGGNDDDLFYGGAGSDSMVGDAGNDTYQVTEAGDVVVENVGGGTDYVFTTVDWNVTSGNIEGVYVIGAGRGLTGSAFADVLVADATGATILYGGAGSDALYGQAGADLLVGEAGNDTLRGGSGADYLIGRADNDQLVGGAGADTFGFDAPGWGYDQIFDFVSGTDHLDMRGSGATFATLNFYSAGGNSAVIYGDARIDVYGVASLSASDFVF